MTSISIDRTDGLSSATAIKGPCRVATTENITLSGLQTVNGVALAVGDRVLVKDQDTASQNGIYVVDTGPWRRAKDFSGNRDVKTGTRVWVTDGVTSAPADYMVTTANPIVIGTTGITLEVAPFSFSTAAASVRDYLDVAPYVATRAALKALDTTKDTVAYLTELGFERKYIWRTGDYSAEVTADPVGEKYLKADAVASSSGAWVWEHVDRNEEHPFSGAPTILRESENGHTWFQGCLRDSANMRQMFFHTRSPMHNTTNGAGIWRTVSRDFGLTLKEEQTLLCSTTRNSRAFVFGEPNGLARLYVQQLTEASATTRLVLKSTDKFYSNVETVDVTSGLSFGHHPFGKIHNLPASLGSHGSDTLGQVVYTYGGNNIRCLYTGDDWADYDENGALITPPDGITQLAEAEVIECGAANKRLAIVRVENPGDANYWAANITDGISAGTPWDTGLYGGKTPPRAWFERRTNRVNLYRYNRPVTGNYDSNYPPNAFLWTWEDYDYLAAGNEVRRNWSVSSILPDLATGYGDVVVIDGKPVLYGVCGESNLEGAELDWTSSRRSKTKEFVLGHVPFAVGTKPSINKNEIGNPQFRVWQNGTSFDAAVLGSSTTPHSNGAMTADGVFVSLNSGITGTASRVDLAAVYERIIPGGPNYGLNINFSAGGSGKVQSVMIRKRDVARWADNVATWKIWMIGTPPSTMECRAQISHDGTSYSEVSTSGFVSLTPLRTTQAITVVEASFDIPSVVGDTITSAGFVEFQIRTVNEDTDYTICSWKLEEGADATELLAMPENESLALCMLEREVIAGASGVRICDGGAVATTAFNGTLTYGPKASTPTITASGTAANFELHSDGAAIQFSSLPTFSVAGPTRSLIAAVVTGATAGHWYQARFGSSATTADKIVIATGFSA